MSDFVLTAERISLKSFSLGFIADVSGIDCEGTREELVDACLLRLRRYQTNAVRSAAVKKVLRAVTGTEPVGDYDELLRERLQAGGFKDETDWLVSRILGTNASLAHAALSVSKGTKEERIHKAAHRVVANRGVRAGVRAVAIELTATNKDKPALLALCTVLDDDTTTAFRLEDMAPYRKGYPFRERMAIKLARPLIEKEYAASASKTIGDLARDALKNATGKEWGRDAARWREWVESRKS